MVTKTVAIVWLLVMCAGAAAVGLHVFLVSIVNSYQIIVTLNIILQGHFTES